MRARFAVTARWSRMPALVKWGLGGAAAAGVVVVAVFALGLAAGSEDGDGGLSPGVWVAVAQRDAEESVIPDGQTGSTQYFLLISVIRHDGSDRRTVGERGDWVQLAISPNGEWLYALGVDDDGLISVVLFGLAGQDDIRHQMEFEDSPQGIPRWSPDSTRVAVATDGELSLFGTDASAVRWVAGADEPYGNLSSAHWSADSQRFAIISQTSLALFYRDGALESAHELTDPWLDAIPFDREVADSAYLSGVQWEGADRLHAFVNTTASVDGETWRITGIHAGTAFDWGQPENVEWEDHPFWRQSQEIVRVREHFADAAIVESCGHSRCPAEVQDGVVVTHAPAGTEPRTWRDRDDVRVGVHVSVNGEWHEVPLDISFREVVPTFLAWDVVTIR